VSHFFNPFYKKFNILINERTGFKDNKSTKAACHSFIENIQQALDKHFHVVGIFLARTKARDVINHDILLYKLESCSVRYFKFMVYILLVAAYIICLIIIN
jgi:hypothetical protein